MYQYNLILRHSVQQNLVPIRPNGYITKMLQGILKALNKLQLTIRFRHVPVSIHD